MCTLDAQARAKNGGEGMIQRRSESGVTVVEYALLIAAFTTLLVVTLPWLLDSAGEQYEDKASAISD